MAADPNQLRYLAAKGHFGHEALLDPDTFVTQGAPKLGIQVAKNSPNEFGISGDYATLGQGQEPIPSKSTGEGKSIRTQEQADLNARLLQQGIPPAQILQMEQSK